LRREAPEETGDQAMPTIDTDRIQSMVTQLRTMAARAQAPSAPSEAIGMTDSVGASKGSAPVDFSTALKGALDGVNGMQQNADALGQRFALGDDSVNLSDVMIATQKASIAFQTTAQVRNKLVSAYHDIMNMSV
jgi:flagellar hook-basal body complex protein FliE